MKQENEEFFCEFCNKLFSKKYNLNRHIKLNRCVKLKNIENENILLKKKMKNLKKN